MYNDNNLLDTFKLNAWTFRCQKGSYSVIRLIFHQIPQNHSIFVLNWGERVSCIIINIARNLFIENFAHSITFHIDFFLFFGIYKLQFIYEPNQCVMYINIMTSMNCGIHHNLCPELCHWQIMEMGRERGNQAGRQANR